jgi:prepilin-type N-terminal cleavage/methylation domain-containing protein
MKRTNSKSGKIRQINSGVCSQCGIARQRMIGFTLVELLVVIAIIALLLSILMPALTKTRNQAWRVICRNNLHQVSTAVQMYSQENKEKFSVGNAYNYPTSNFGDSNHNGIHHESTDDGFIATDLAPYLTKDYTIFLCPANKTVARMPAYNFEKKPKGVTTYQWYKSGNLNLDNTINYGYFIYYYYFGNYPWEGFNTARPTVNLLTSQELRLKAKGLLYPQKNVGPRAKLMQDISTSDKQSNSSWKDSHGYPNGLYTDGSVEALKRQDLKAQKRYFVIHYW